VLALLEAARHNPEDDTPRLALADWLVEHEQPQRAQFIRLQCQVGPPSASLATHEHLFLQARCRAMLEQHGGAWLGPLWRWPAHALWHRGLLAFRIPRRFHHGLVLQMAAWLDSLLLEIGGRQSLERAVTLVTQTQLNHLCLDLRTALSEAALLERLAWLPESACLRTLSFSWPLGLLRHPEGLAHAVPAQGEAVLEQLLSSPLGRHLSHLGSDFPFTSTQEALIRSRGVEPVHAPQRWWMHRLDPRLFRKPDSSSQE
jgi:uncharacterized protein (TIGR02996 family)